MIQTKFKYRKPLVPLNLDKVEFIVIHHAAAKTATPEQIHEWHLKRDNGTWAGFGYNAYIRKDGTVYIGRGDHIGAQVANKNSTTYGICVEGNYQVEKTMPKAQLDALVGYIKSILPKFKNLKGIKKHSDFQNKACPGKYFPFDELLTRIKEQPQLPTLKRGINNQHVKKLQEALNKYGYKLKVDGDFGPLTEGAVRDFQRTHGFTGKDIDGIVGPKTWSKLYER